ncbi:hypothetical protein NC653_000377 [Populus alba x Populus x berolinensis]|uniref:Uncharacterized protein n=1 Tax=Populus alba x Populus x berolinensis TaxID=444605 RepID=A0AAD6RIF8_9ROSI|nr:hypothetical protein NC653_000377 [Populus alba x Populus x berolinensis]
MISCQARKLMEAANLQHLVKSIQKYQDMLKFMNNRTSFALTRPRTLNLIFDLTLE